MRKFLLTILLLLTLAFGYAAEVTATWGPVSGTNLAKYHVYGSSNGVTKEFATVGWPTNTVKFELQAGVPHTFYVTTENAYFLESAPSPNVRFTYPVSLAPPITWVTINCDSYSRTNNRWNGVLLYWNKAMDKYAVTEYRLHYESKSQTNIWTLRTNFYKISSVPVTSCKFYVEQVNLLGVSPIDPRGVLYPNEKRPEKIADTLTK